MTDPLVRSPGSIKKARRVPAREAYAILERLLLEVSQAQDVDLAIPSVLRSAGELLGAVQAAAVISPESGAHPRCYAEPPSPERLTRLRDAANELLEAAKEEPRPRTVDTLPGEHPGAIPTESWVGDQTCLLVPVARRDAPLGVLLFVFDGPLPTSPEPPLVWVPTVASLTALILENARLFDAALLQAIELGSFYETVTATVEGRDMQPMLVASIERASQLLSAVGGAIFLADDEHKVLRMLAAHSLPDLPPGWVVRYGDGILGTVALSQEPGILADAHAVPPFPLPLAMQASTRPTRWLCVPLLWRQRLIGVLALAAEKSRPAFGETDVRVARIAAGQAANALGVAGLLDAEREQRRISEALHEASLAINRAVGLEQVLQEILGQVQQAFGCDAANFQIYREGRASIVRARGYEQFSLTFEDLRSITFEVTAHDNYRRMMQGEAVYMPETHSDPAWQIVPGFEWIRSWAGVPIRFGDEILGFLNLDSETPGAFGESTPRWLAAFAAHAAVAMNNARLYHRLTDEHVKLVRVYEIGQRVAGSLVPAEILHNLLEGVLEPFAGSYGAAYAIAGEEGTDIPAAPLITCGSERSIAGASLPAELVAARVAQRQSPFQEIIQTAAGRSWVSGVPLFVGDRLWGSALIWSPVSGEGGPPPLGVLAATSQQAGLALLNAEQHNRVQRRLAELTLIQGVASAIAQRLEADAVLTTVTERLHDSLGYPAVQVYFRDGGDLVLRTFSGPKPVATRLPISRGIIGRVARTGKPAIVTDVRKDPDYVAGLVGTKAEMAVPVREQDQVIGVVNIESSDPAQVQPENLELLAVLADQVSVALQNAALYEEVSNNVELLGERVRERTSQLEQALEQARAADRSKAQFVAEISHELRTPMTNIGLYLDLLDMGRDDRRSEYMAILRHETERLGVLIEQLLAISQYDRDKVELHVLPVDINGLIRVLIGDRARLIESRGIHLIVEPDENLPKVPADPRLIMQVLTNLLTNSTNYTPSGGTITIRTLSRQMDSRLWVGFSIADTGPGIPEDERPHVFERFYRGIVGRASGIPGTGLGLAICKEIVERHQGRIQLTSEGGQGTTVSVWLPAQGPQT